MQFGVFQPGTIMNKRAKRITFIILSLISLVCLVIWLFACLFAAGQLYSAYDLWEYLSDAPIAVAIIIGLLAAFVGFLVAAIRTKPEKK